MSENQIMRRAWLALGLICRLFRLNSGMGYVPMGSAKPFQLSCPGVLRLDDGKVIRLEAGAVIMFAGRPIALGLGMPNGKPIPGPGDLIGWTSKTITAEMVGCKAAIFTSIETKTDEDSARREAQHNFIAQVHKAGGIAGFAHTPEMALQIVNGFSPIR